MLIANNDSEKIKQLANSMMGAAAILGALSIREIAGQIEEAGKNRAIDLARALLPTMEAEFEKLKEVLKN